MVHIYYLGLDLGGTNVKAGIVNENYEIIGRASVKTMAGRPAEEIANTMAEAANLAAKAAGLSLGEIARVGIGSPGMIDGARGVIEFAGNLNFKNVPLGQMVAHRLNLPVKLGNDADAAAYGEFLAGAGKGCRNFIAITLGTGVGSGIILEGKLLVGGNNAGSELGHMVIQFNGELCTCGRRGCFESYASATALIRQTKKAMEADATSKMWGLTEDRHVSGRTAFEAMRQGDQTAAKVVSAYIDYVACGVINAINIFQPEILCIGGGICNEGDYLLVPMIERVRSEQFGGRKEKETKICRAVLGNDAGIIGAAFLETRQ